MYHKLFILLTSTRLLIGKFIWIFYCLLLIILRLSFKMEADVFNRSLNKKRKVFGIKIMQFEQLKVKSFDCPKARSGHRLVCDSNGDLYSFGGYNSDLFDSVELETDEDWLRTRPLFKELWKYNISTNEWIKLKINGEYPNQLASHCVELLNDNLLLVYGGTSVPFETYPSNNLYLCDLKLKKWTLLNPICDKESQFPTKKYGQALCLDVDSQKVYVSGGTDGFSFCIDLHCFDFNKKLWTQLGSTLDVNVESRYRHEMCLFKSKLFVFGGGSIEKDCKLSTLPVFDLKAKLWTKYVTFGHRVNDVVRFPAARRCHIICRYKDYIYLIGGLSEKKICGDLWKFDLPTQKWTLLIEQIPIPIYFHGATVSRYGQLTYFGGLTILKPNKPNVRSKKLFSVWIDIPPLKEIAWRAVLYYNDNFRDRSESELNRLGLPFPYIQRLKN